MDSELHVPEEAQEYDPTIHEHKMDEGVRGLLSYLIRQSERTAKPLSIHAYTDRTHLRETIRSNLAPLIPPRYKKAANLLYDRIEKLADPVLIDSHPTALIRMVINISNQPVVDRLTPDAPAAYAVMNIENGTVRHRAVLAKDIQGIDPELDEVPAGAAILIQPADPPPTDRSTQENKPGGNHYMFNRSELNEIGEHNAELLRRGQPLSGFKENNKGAPTDTAAEDIALATGAVGVAAALAHNRRQEEFFKKRREDDERFRRETERNSAFFENKKREEETFFRNKEAEERRRQTLDYETRLREDVEADNAVAAAIASIEATFGLIHQREGAIAAHPHDSSELAVFGGEVGALSRFLASGRGSAALRDRAAIDVQKAHELGAEFRHIQQDEAAAETATATNAANNAALKKASDQSAEAAAIATFETELARVRQNEWIDRLNPQESPDVAALRAAEAGLAGFPDDDALGARAGADFELGREELGAVMQPESAAQSEALRNKVALEPAELAAKAQEARAAMAVEAETQRTEATAKAQEETATVTAEAQTVQQEAVAEVARTNAETRTEEAQTALGERRETTRQAQEQALANIAEIAHRNADARAEQAETMLAERREITRQAQEQAHADTEEVARKGTEVRGELANEALAERAFSGGPTADVSATPQQPSERAEATNFIREQAEEKMAEGVKEEVARPIREMEPTTENRSTVQSDTHHAAEPVSEHKPESGEQSTERRGDANPLREEIEGHMILAAQEEVARPIQEMQTTLQGTTAHHDQSAGEAATAPPYQEVKAEAHNQPQQSSERDEERPLHEAIEEHMATATQEQIAEPIKNMEPTVQTATHAGGVEQTPPETPTRPEVPEAPHEPGQVEEQPGDVPEQPIPSRTPDQPSTPAQPEVPPPEPIKVGKGPLHEEQAEQNHLIREEIGEQMLQATQNEVARLIQEMQPTLPAEMAGNQPQNPEMPPPTTPEMPHQPATPEQPPPAPETPRPAEPPTQTPSPTEVPQQPEVTPTSKPEAHDGQQGQSHMVRDEVGEQIMASSAQPSTTPPTAEMPEQPITSEAQAQAEPITAEQRGETIKAEDRDTVSDTDHEHAKKETSQVGEIILTDYAVKKAFEPAAQAPQSPPPPPQTVQQRKSVAKAEKELAEAGALRHGTDFVTEHDGRETEGLRRLQKQTKAASSPRRAIQKRSRLAKPAKPAKVIKAPAPKKTQQVAKTSARRQPNKQSVVRHSRPIPVKKKAPPQSATQKPAQKRIQAQGLPKPARSTSLPEPQPE